MSRITFNHLNLPHTISGTISNVYDAAGKKWQSTQAGVTTTHFGDIEYERPIHDDRSDDVGQCVKGVNPPLAGRVAAIKAIYHQDGERTRSSHTKWLVGEVKRNVRTAVKRGAAMESKHFVRQPKCFCGRILNNNSSYEYQYYIKDHTPRRTCLGNVRIVCNSAAVIQSEQHYYPFGLNMEGNFTATGYNQKYRYNGKELYGGLGWYDYGARYYDPALGRFTGVDKLADEPEQVDKSPYAYAWNNPIKYDDPEGNCPRCQQYNQLKREVGKLVSFVKEWFSPKTISPVKDPVISSEFVASRRSPIDGKFKPHKGIDIVDKDKNKTAGKDVVSATDGTVVSKTSKDDGNGAGNRIHIKDEDGYKHSYFHLSDNNFGNGIKSGSEVEQGQKIGEIGNTGASKGAHLHYEIRDPKGKPINPREGNKGLKNAPTDEQVRKNN